MALIFLRLDGEAALRIMGSAEPLLLILSLLFGVAIIFADGAFWAYSMRAVGLKMPFKTASLFSFVGWFFSNIAPSTVGADLFRAAQMRYAGATTGRAVRLVVAARLMALAALLLVIGAGAPFVLGYFPETLDRTVLGAIYAAAFIGFGLFLIAAPILRRRPFKVGPVRSDHVADLSADLGILIRKVDLAGWIYLIAQHLLRVVSVWAIARAVGSDVSLVALFALVPLALLVAMAPVSFAGWGVREASFVGFLGLAGTDAATALAISILYGLTRALIGAAGGLAWLLTRADHYVFAVEPAKDQP